MLADLGQFLRALARDSIALLSGIASVILSAISATGVLAVIPNWFFWMAAGTCVLFAAFRVWQKEHHTVVDLQENVPPRIEVQGIPELLVTNGTRPFFIVPEVTIANRAHAKNVSIGAVLWARISGGGETYCPPETKPFIAWESSRRTYTNQPLIFPLNLQPRQTAHGYIAFCGDNLHGVAHERVADESGLQYYATRIEFNDYLAEPPHDKDPIFSQEIRFHIARSG